MVSLVVGLGNIGSKYENTRHNVGFDVISLLEKEIVAKRLPTKSTHKYSVKKIDERQIFLACPTTMMNGSGLAILELMNELQLELSQMLVVLDDFNLPLGSIRFRKGGSAGGHNGLQSIIETLDTDQFPRLRLGTGPIAEKTDTVEYVLEKFKKEELLIVDKMLEDAKEAVIFSLRHCLDEAMTKYNYNPA